MTRCSISDSKVPVLPAGEQEALLGLWHSLVTEIRIKLTKLEYIGELSEASLDEPLDNEFVMTANGGLISVWIHVASGERSWNAVGPHLDMAEPWCLSPRGKFKLDGEIMDVSAAADRFIAKVSGKWRGAPPA